MRRIIYAFCLVLCVGSAAAADEGPSVVATPSGHPISDSIAQIPLNRMTPPELTYCCNQKGALIGAAVGGAMGWYVAFMSVDSGNRNADILAVTGITAALGAAIGAHVPPPRRRFPARVSIAPAVTKTTQAGVVSVRF
jgi:hypothetical protein